MNPRLAAVAGPLKGSTFLLKDEDVLVGRESSNQICLADPSVSRRHCVIKKEDGQYKIVDLDSLNSSSNFCSATTLKLGSTGAMGTHYRPIEHHPGHQVLPRGRLSCSRGTILIAFPQRWPKVSAPAP